MPKAPPCDASSANEARIELCRCMEALRDGTPHDLSTKAREIRALQDAWKALGPDGDESAARLWHRFKRAADAAYAPCAALFEKQKATREHNLAQRTRICTTLESFASSHDWQAPDWKRVHATIGRARSAWRKYDDIPNASRKALQKRFRLAIDPLEAKLREEQDRNHKAKNALIRQVRAALDDSERPLGELIQTAKQAQVAWKMIGVTDRRVDQKLWKQFRGFCDRVFAKREAPPASNPQIPPTGDCSKRRSPCNAVLLEARRRANLCTQLERGELDRATVNRLWDGEVTLPSRWAERLRDRLQASIP
ncbi:MAG: DUF349 domain-containing protein, partial [Pseudomonadales bacterium]|nr:DUF349 domain-containing protein [Pseudomonadales bacterium]